MNNKINVLHIIWSLGLGGAERALIYLAKGLDRERFNVIVCCLNDKGVFARELEEEGIEVVPLNKRGKFDASVIFKLVSVIKRYRVDIVHTHMWGGNLWGRIAAKLANVPVVIATEQNVDAWKNSFYLFLDRVLSRCSDKIIAVSKNVAEFYANVAGIEPNRIKVIFNPVDLKKYEFPFSKEKEFALKNNREITLGVIGRLVPQKGHRYFLLAVKELLKEHKVKGLIVGAGPLDEQLKEYSQELGLNGNVVFTGIRQDISDLLKSIDILVLPSLREGLPLVALEAMASGVPVVATKVGGSPEAVIDKQTGILIEPKQHLAIKDAISNLINDKELAKELIRNARKRAEENFSVTNIVCQTQDLYDEFYNKKVKQQ
ncbi:glycosyltransferase [Candidatus Omnitrophota bacterium]